VEDIAGEVRRLTSAATRGVESADGRLRGADVFLRDHHVIKEQVLINRTEMPAEFQKSLENMNRYGNPMGESPRKRAAWTQGLDFEVPVMANVGEADVLWWVGCAGAYDPRNQKVTKAIAKILHAAGIKYAILGEEERCTCESARRLGNEYLYQTATQEIIEVWGHYVMDKVFDDRPGWETQNMLTVARLITAAAIRRTESRGVHFRTDYPQTDKIPYHTSIQMENGEHKVGAIPVTKIA
jgi:hypothetical protein